MVAGNINIKEHIGSIGTIPPLCYCLDYKTNIMIGEKGNHFGMRTTTGNFVHKQVGKRKRLFEECVCECGTKRFVSRENLVAGSSTNCGCIRKQKCSGLCKKSGKHGLSRNRFYYIYYSMKNRCNSILCSAYKYYGGRGIKCERKTFHSFYEDMRNSYIEHMKQYGKKNTTIDRIDVNGNYSKENCRRATIIEQANNKRKTNKVII